MDDNSLVPASSTNVSAADSAVQVSSTTGGTDGAVQVYDAKKKSDTLSLSIAKSMKERAEIVDNNTCFGVIHIRAWFWFLFPLLALVVLSYLYYQKRAIQVELMKETFKTIQDGSVLDILSAKRHEDDHNSKYEFYIILSTFVFAGALVLAFLCNHIEHSNDTNRLSAAIFYGARQTEQLSDKAQKRRDKHNREKLDKEQLKSDNQKQISKYVKMQVMVDYMKQDIQKKEEEKKELKKHLDEVAAQHAFTEKKLKEIETSKDKLERDKIEQKEKMKSMENNDEKAEAEIKELQTKIDQTQMKLEEIETKERETQKSPTQIEI